MPVHSAMMDLTGQLLLVACYELVNAIGGKVRTVPNPAPTAPLRGTRVTHRFPAKYACRTLSPLTLSWLSLPQRQTPRVFWGFWPSERFCVVPNRSNQRRIPHRPFHIRHTPILHIDAPQHPSPSRGVLGSRIQMIYRVTNHGLIRLFSVPGTDGLTSGTYPTVNILCTYILERPFCSPALSALVVRERHLFRPLARSIQGTKAARGRVNFLGRYRGKE
jgi:hypothetical protein